MTLPPRRLVVMTGEFEPGSLAYHLRWIANYLDEDEATSYTSDEVYEALTRLSGSADRKRAAAEHIRGARRRGRR